MFADLLKAKNIACAQILQEQERAAELIDQLLNDDSFWKEIRALLGPQMKLLKGPDDYD